MKQIGILIFTLSLTYCVSCTQQTEETEKNTSVESGLYFGDSINSTGAVESSTLVTAMGTKDSLPIKLSGKILDVCQKKGCWMEVDAGGGQTMRVSFKDYGFFVPKDAAGKIAVMDGFAKIDTISIEELKHYAEDAGKSKAEIEKITAPEIEISYEAYGVIIKEPK